MYNFGVGPGLKNFSLGNLVETMMSFKPGGGLGPIETYFMKEALTCGNMDSTPPLKQYSDPEFSGRLQKKHIRNL